MTLSDLRQRIRDRSVLIFALVVPLALMFVFNLTFGGATDLELEPVTVAMAAPAGDPLAGVVIRSLSGVEAVDVNLREVDAEDARAQARSGEATLGIVVPDGFGQAVSRGQAVVEVTEGDGAGIEGDIVLAVLRGVLDRLHAGTVAATAARELGVPDSRLGPVAQQAAARAPGLTLVEGEPSDEQLSMKGALVAGQAGLFLLFTVGFGVLGLVAERQQGTLARLLSMPMHPGLIVVAKAMVSLVLGVAATGVLLTAGSLFFDVSFGAPVAVAVIVVCAVMAGTSLMFVIARVARTAEQANIAQSIFALLLGIAGGAFFPITASGLAGSLLDLNPIAAFTRGLGITSGGGGLADVGTPVAIMLGFAVVAALASRLVPDRGRAL